MATVTIKDLPAPLHHALKERAAKHGRSLNREVLSCLRSAVSVEQVDVAGMLAGADRVRKRDSVRLQPKLVKRALQEGRL